jgi:hypothetical protein
MTKARNLATGAITGIVMSAGAFATDAAASPLPITFNPNGIPGISGYSPQTATDIQGTSDALIQQTGGSTQVEQGWIEVTGFQNNGSPVGTFQSGEVIAPGAANFYTLFVTFSATIQGISGFGPGQSGTIAPGAFNFVLKADPSSLDTFNSGTTNASGGTAPSIVDNGAADIVLAYGTSIAGSAGFQSVTGAPTFDVVSTFNVCNGTVVGPCGSFDATKYLTAPNPFYNFAFTSTTTGSAANITCSPGDVCPDPTDSPPNVLLNGIVTDTNFLIPEPTSLALIGSGLILFGFISRRRRRDI